MKTKIYFYRALVLIAGPFDLRAVDLENRIQVNVFPHNSTYIATILSQPSKSVGHDKYRLRSWIFMNL